MSTLDPNPDATMHQHPILDILSVVGVSALACLTNEKTLIFLSICFTLYRWYLAWKKRNDHKKGDE